MEKGRKKRTADIAEKLGVGFILGVVAQGIFAKDLFLRMYVLSAIILAIAASLLLISIFLSREE